MARGSILILLALFLAGAAAGAEEDPQSEALQRAHEIRLKQAQEAESKRRQIEEEIERLKAFRQPARPREERRPNPPIELAADDHSRAIMRHLCEGKEEKTIPVFRVQKLLLYYELDAILLPALKADEANPAASALLDKLTSARDLLFKDSSQDWSPIAGIETLMASPSQRAKGWGEDVSVALEKWNPEVIRRTETANQFRVNLLRWIAQTAMGKSLAQELRFYACPWVALKNAELDGVYERIRDRALTERNEYSNVYRGEDSFANAKDPHNLYFPEQSRRLLGGILRGLYRTQQEINSSRYDRRRYYADRDSIDLNTDKVRPLPIPWIVTANSVGPSFYHAVPARDWQRIADLMVQLAQDPTERPEKFLDTLGAIETSLGKENLKDYFTRLPPRQHAETIRFALDMPLEYFDAKALTWLAPGPVYREGSAKLESLREKMVKMRLDTVFSQPLATKILPDPRLLQVLDASKWNDPKSDVYDNGRLRGLNELMNDAVAILPEDAVATLETVHRLNPSVAEKLKAKLALQKLGLPARDFSALLKKPVGEGDQVPVTGALKWDLRNALGEKFDEIRFNSLDVPHSDYYTHTIDRSTLLLLLKKPEVARRLSNTTVMDYRPILPK